MKVLVCHRPGGAFGYISDGWINALVDRGHVVARWDGLSDSWRSFDPDLYCGCSGHKQPIPARRGKCKVAIHVNPYGPVKIPTVDETKENITWTLAQRPDVVFGYGHRNDYLLWSYWTEREGIVWVPMPTAGDYTIFHSAAQADHKTTDIVYLGGRWPYKGRSIDKYLLPVLADPRLSYKVYGWGEWPTGISSGHLPDSDARQFLSQGRVAPCISEPHTQLHGFDIPERMFKAALSGTLVIHDPVPDIKQLMPSLVVSQNPANFLDLCVHYSRPAQAVERAALAAQQCREVLESHTYHHRVRTLLEATGFAAEGRRMTEV